MFESYINEQFIFIFANILKNILELYLRRLKSKHT